MSFSTRSLLIILFVACFFKGKSQVTVNDSVTLGPGYVNMSFYSMADGEQANVNVLNWDIQIGISQRSASLRTNDAAGVELYAIQNSDTANWNSPDTANMWQLFNSDTTWDVGAFNALGDNIFNYGWGAYDQISHNVYGNKFFIIKTVNGNYKKIFVEGLIYDPPGQYYVIRYADLDNSNEVRDTVNKVNYPTKSFVYYSLDDNLILDIEPNSTDWDLVFRRYLEELSPNFYYPVTGALSNPDITTAEAHNVNVMTADDSGLSYVADISNIGSDWKDFNMTTFMWEFQDSLAYFVAAQDQYIYRLVFTYFGGSATGKINFNKTLLNTSTAIEKTQNINTMAVYPNPAINNASILFTLQKDTQVRLAVYNLMGKLLYNDNHSGNFGLNKVDLPINELSNGYYFVTIDDGSSQLNCRFIKSE